MTTEETWYTITVVQHETTHPRRYVEGDTAKPVEVIACTVLPHLAGSILRATADEIDPPRPLLRGEPIKRPPGPKPRSL